MHVRCDSFALLRSGSGVGPPAPYVGDAGLSFGHGINLRGAPIQ